MPAAESPTGVASGRAGRTASRHAWGPVRLDAEWPDPALAAALSRHCNQFDAPWTSGPGEPCCWRLCVGEAEPGGAVGGTAVGGFLTTVHLSVDRAAGGAIESRGRRGSLLRIDESARTALLWVPAWARRPEVIEEAEQQLTLLSSRAWALAGWTPVHGATLVAPGADRCAVICAPSGSGKTTLTFSLLRRGWRTLGDDKLLARRVPGGVEARSLARRLHLDPAASRWLAEAGDIRRFPAYSPWTDKRHVDLEAVWPGRLLSRAMIALVVRIRREPGTAGLRWAPLDQAGRFDTAARQVAIPGEAGAARPLVGVVGAIASVAQGIELVVGDDAFDDSSALDALSRALGATLAGGTA
ncbi:MAG: hypothetical protein JNJ48_00235 [Phycisphaerae bacterium]|nr:hypothetical protein [Phycisphaerae bacterium]